MGMDIPDVEIAVQWGLWITQEGQQPRLSELWQRFGRVARGEGKKGRAVWFVPWYSDDSIGYEPQPNLDGVGDVAAASIVASPTSTAIASPAPLEASTVVFPPNVQRGSGGAKRGRRSKHQLLQNREEVSRRIEAVMNTPSGSVRAVVEGGSQSAKPPAPKKIRLPLDERGRRAWTQEELRARVRWGLLIGIINAVCIREAVLTELLESRSDYESREPRARMCDCCSRCNPMLASVEWACAGKDSNVVPRRPKKGSAPLRLVERVEAWCQQEADVVLREGRVALSGYAPPWFLFQPHFAVLLQQELKEKRKVWHKADKSADLAGFRLLTVVQDWVGIMLRLKETRLCNLDADALVRRLFDEVVSELSDATPPAPVADSAPTDPSAGVPVRQIVLELRSSEYELSDLLQRIAQHCPSASGDTAFALGRQAVESSRFLRGSVERESRRTIGAANATGAHGSYGSLRSRIDLNVSAAARLRVLATKVGAPIPQKNLKAVPAGIREVQEEIESCRVASRESTAQLRSLYSTPTMSAIEKLAIARSSGLTRPFHLAISVANLQAGRAPPDAGGRRVPARRSGFSVAPSGSPILAPVSRNLDDAAIGSGAAGEHDSFFKDGGLGASIFGLDNADDECCSQLSLGNGPDVAGIDPDIVRSRPNMAASSAKQATDSSLTAAGQTADSSLIPAGQASAGARLSSIPSSDSFPQHVLPMEHDSRALDDHRHVTPVVPSVAATITPEHPRKRTTSALTRGSGRGGERRKIKRPTQRVTDAGTQPRQRRPVLNCDLGDVSAEAEGHGDAEEDLRRSGVKLDFLRRRIAEQPGGGGEGRGRRVVTPSRKIKFIGG